MLEMRKGCGLAVFLVLLACGARPVSKPEVSNKNENSAGNENETAYQDFVLCDRSTKNDERVVIDFTALWGLEQDIAGEVHHCEGGGSCIDFPLLISVPPHLPTAGKPRIYWSVGRYRFTMTLNSDGDYRLESKAPVNARSGVILYDHRGGVKEYRSPVFVRPLTRCGGHLTFRDLEKLTGGDRKPAAMPPIFSVGDAGERSNPL
jgi:hypothetical protein